MNNKIGQFDFPAFLMFSILRYFINYLWYSPMLFGDIWMQENNIKPRQIEILKNQGKMIEVYIWQFLLQSVSLFIHYQFLIYLQKELLDSIIFTCLLYIGFVIPTLYYSSILDNNSFKLFSINAGYHLVSMIFFSVFIFMFEDLRGE